MFGIGFSELIVILFIILILFGAKNIPEIARNLGKCLGAFKKGMHETKEELKNLSSDSSTDKPE